MRRLRDESGQASVEFAGVLFWLLLATFAMWQLLLVAWTVNQATNAARTASRVDARGGDAAKAGRQAVSPVLRKGMRVEMKGEKATVRVRMPLIVPGLGSERVRAERSAELPQ